MVDLVLDALVSTYVRGELGWGGLVRGQAGDALDAFEGDLVEVAVLLPQLRAKVKVDADPQHRDETNEQLGAPTMPLVLTREPSHTTA